MRKLTALTLALLLMLSTASAEVFTGKTVSGAVSTVTAEAGGKLEALDVELGQRVTAGEVLGQTAVEKVFATQDGTVAGVEPVTGNEVDGTVVKLQPVSRYTVYCTTSKAYGAPANQYITVGETLYVKCTRNGTHRGLGRVISVTGEYYTVEMTAGELFLGETVYLYRDSPHFSNKKRVGIGTVTEPEVEEYQISGVLQEMKVEVGDTVERGQLLYTWSADAETRIISPIDGIVTSLNYAKGDQVVQDGIVAEVTALEDIVLELTVDEDQATAMPVGTRVTYTRTMDKDERLRYGTVILVDELGEEGTFRVQIQPDETEEYIGLTVEIMTE